MDTTWARVPLISLSLIGLLLAPGAPLGDPPRESAAVTAAVERGLGWLRKDQRPDGSWGRQYTIAITSFACLSFLAAEPDPFGGKSSEALQKGLKYLLSQQKDGLFVKQGHTWIHGQGFAALALSEAYGRSLTSPTKPDLDRKQLKTIVTQAVAVIGKSQSTSGGWWYTQGSPSQHEGSTTVCAVQALVSAANFGIKMPRAVLDKGFEYLKKCQNPDGGFDYKLGPGTTSMFEGTAGGVATLGLMKKFDFAVMFNGYEFLQKKGPAAYAQGRFPYYGHFYGRVGLRLLSQEMTHLQKAIGPYEEKATKDLLSWQQKDGSWPVRGWMKQHREPAAYATAWATLALLTREGRLSIFNRDAPPAK